MTGPPRIYIIEDSVEFGEYLLDLVSSEIPGAKARLIADGIEGLQACLSEPPAVIVLDLNLPSLRGEEICRLVRSSPAHRDVRILICSDMPEAQKREMELLKLGADRYIEKPFVEEEFLAVLTGLLGVTGDDTPSEDSTIGAGTVSGTGEEAAAEPRFEGYRLLGVIGGGAMGTVYKAEQTSLGRIVALKVFLRRATDSSDYLPRFLRESKIMAALDHANILRVYDSGNTGYTYYIVMEFVDGGALSQQLFTPDLDSARLAVVILQTTDAIAYLHARGVIHRDIKPANIMLTSAGAPKVGDFGISRARLPDELEEFTRRHVMMGTRIYMAPELMMGGRASELTDQYALGRTLLRLFEGRESSLPPVPLATIRPDLPRLAAAVDRCLHVDPAQRFPNVKELHGALVEAIAAEGSHLAPGRTTR